MKMLKATEKKKDQAEVSKEEDPMMRLGRVEAAVRFVASQLSKEQYDAFASCFPSIANKK